MLSPKANHYGQPIRGNHFYWALNISLDPVQMYRSKLQTHLKAI
jgi:hypothetical protein